MAFKSLMYNVFGIVIVAYIVNVVYTFWQLYHPPACNINSNLSGAATDASCVWPMCDCSRDMLDLAVFYGDASAPSGEDFNHKTTHRHTLLLRERIKCSAEMTRSLRLPATRSVSNSYAHVFIACGPSPPANNNKKDDNAVSSFSDHDLFANIPPSAYHYYRSISTTKLGDLMEEKQEVNLLNDVKKTTTNQNSRKSNNKTIPILHIHNTLNIHVMYDNYVLNKSAVVHELLPLIKIVPMPRSSSPSTSSSSSAEKMLYLPVLYVDEMSRRRDNYLPVRQYFDKTNNDSAAAANLTISYSPTTLGKIRLFTVLGQSFVQLKTLGFRQSDIEDVVGIFTDTNLYLLITTMIVSVLHVALDFMAFKNDISFWRTKGTQQQNRGMSARTVVWRLISSCIIFLYLLDEKSSALVLVPCFLAIGVEAWKLSKVWHIEFNTNLSWWPRLRTISDARTEKFDAEAMKYLSWLMYPICIAGAAYSLLYVKHRSWYSWLIHSLVNGIYAFGFLFMVPQLFLNYRLKSVAHLPWRAFAYKAVNTFIDDLFAFIIRMPTAHRLACFRDDIVFIVYLYQRWIYPVDVTRAAEVIGASGGEVDGEIDSVSVTHRTTVLSSEKTRKKPQQERQQQLQMARQPMQRTSKVVVHDTTANSSNKKLN